MTTRSVIRWSVLFLLGTLIVLVSCNRYDLVPNTPIPDSQFRNYDPPPLPIPEPVVEELEELGVEIDTAVPPEIFQATYKGDPYTLITPFGVGDTKDSGDVVSPYWIRLYRYSSAAPNSITVDYCHAGTRVRGIPANIYGDPDTENEVSIIFTVDVTETIENITGDPSTASFEAYQVVTGIIEPNGMRDFQVATVILDKSDPDNIVMPDGQRRILIDGDGFAEQVVLLCE